MRMYLISDNIDTYTGMRLSGVEGVVVHEREELEEALSFVTGQPDIGIVLLTEKLGRDFPELVNDLKLSRRTPLTGTEAAEARILLRIMSVRQSG